MRLMSLHASKGLEFDVVYMIGVEHGILPHEKTVKDNGEAGLEEERRLCYVGLTRARKLLRVTWCRHRQDTFARSRTAKFKASRPSRFLVEAGLMTSGRVRDGHPRSPVRDGQGTAAGVVKRSYPRRTRRGTKAERSRKC